MNRIAFILKFAKKRLMNILLIGNGGREHAMAWKISQSKKLTKLYIAPGNAGTSFVGENININPLDFVAVKNTVLEKNIQLVIVGPEEPLVKGIHDFFLNDHELKNIPIIGPRKIAAQLEGSKDFAKEFMQRHNIPTAKYFTVYKNNFNEGISFLETMNPPYVLKADGLAAGKGVLIINSLLEAKTSLKEMLDGQFGEASKKVVIEEFLKGIELSVFVLTDGNSYITLPEAKDYKRIGENDSGLNTGGMGAVSPVSFATKEFMSKIDINIIQPTINGLKKDNIPYKGFIFFGLINVEGEPFVIEYNVRMGDPETEAVIPRIKSDIVELFEAVANNKIHEKSIEISTEYCTTVMLVSKGYPETYEKGHEIRLNEKINDSLVFHAGTTLANGKIITSGGRVIAVSSLGKSKSEALAKSYANANNILFEGKNFRKDIGFDLL